MPPEEIQSLFDQLGGPLVLYARQWCQAPDDAVQEAFVDLSLTQTEPVCPKAWLYTTTRRKAQNIARSDSRRRRHHRRASESKPNEYANWFRPSASILDAEDVCRGLESLDANQREVLVARVWGGLNFEQLAALMNCSLSSAHRRYYAALEQLKSVISDPESQSSKSPSPQTMAANVGNEPCGVSAPARSALTKPES